MNLTLKRTLHEDCTTGTLTIGDRSWVTIEQPWNDNLPFHSCVPPGIYTLEPHSSPKHPGTWALVNHANLIYHDLPHEPEYGMRADCLIHPANWASELEGCIAPGETLTESARGLMVTNSVKAFTEIQALMGIGTTHTLEIMQ